MRKKRVVKVKAWGDIFKSSVRRGDDWGYSAFLADQYELRKSYGVKGGRK